MKHLSEESIMGLADGILSPQEKEAAEAHMAVCSECREQLKLYQSLDELLLAENVIKAPPVITNRVMQQVELHQKIMLRKAQSRRTLIRFSLIMLLFMVAIIILAFVTGTGLSLNFETPAILVSIREFLEKIKIPHMNPLILYGSASVIILLVSERIIYGIRRNRLAAH